MKVLINGILKIHAIKPRTYSIQVKHLIHDYVDSSIETLNQVSSLCLNAIKFAKSREFNRNTLFHVDNLFFKL